MENKNPIVTIEMENGDKMVAEYPGSNPKWRKQGKDNKFYE